MMTMMLNSNTLERESIYDRAKIELLRKTAADTNSSVEVDEQKFKKSVDAMHDSILTSEYVSRDRMVRKLIDREHTINKLKRNVHAQDKAISVLCQMLLKLKQEGRLSN
jgi:hypothetical protein